MSLKFKMIRAASGYQPGKTPAAYEKLAMHHAATVPVYETYERVIRELGPSLSRRKASVRLTCVQRGTYEDGTPWEQYRARPRSGDFRRGVEHTVTKIRYGADGKTPLSPKMHLVTLPGGDPTQPKQMHVPQTQLIPIAAPIRLKKGSPKAIYRLLKKLERAVGLDNVYRQMAQEAA